MATIKEIAALAGVSRGTVDRVLNNRGSVNEETKQRIEEIAKRLNYQPNKAGILLAAQKKNYKIGVILFADSTLFFQEMMDGINEKMNELSGYNITRVTRMVPFEEDAQLQAIDELTSEGINGLVLSPYNGEKIHCRIDQLMDAGIPVITLNSDIPSRRLAFVGCDFYRCGATAAGLVGRTTFGEIYVGIITGSSHILSHSERIRGFADRIQEAYPNIHIVETVENHDDDVECYKLVRQMLAEHPQINCIYFTAGGVSGGCKAIEEHDKPLSVFAYDNIATTVEYVRKGVITAILCQQHELQGYQSIELLSKYLFENTPPEKDHIYLDVDIRISENL